MEITPVGNKILVLPIDKKEEEYGEANPEGKRLVIPGTANAELQEAEVVNVSKDLQHLFEKGDVVLYPKNAGLQQLYKGVPHLWLRIEPQNSEVWGKVKHEENE